MCYASFIGALALLALPAYVLRNSLVSSGREYSIFKFPEFTGEILPYTGGYDDKGGRWVNIQGKMFPGLIWCLVNKKKRQT